MPRSRLASDPVSYHKPTGQYYVTRGGKRIYLGADHGQALERYHRMGLGLALPEKKNAWDSLTAKELANRYLAAQEANWRNPDLTLKTYRLWVGRFLMDHPGLQVEQLTVEMFATWKLSLRRRGYAAETINHFLNAVRSIYLFAEDTGLMEKAPRLRRVRNETIVKKMAGDKPVYNADQVRHLLSQADLQMKGMILLGLNCGFGPKDIHDLTWKNIEGNRITLSRSKTGVGQTFLLWPETLNVLEEIRTRREELIAKLGRRHRERSDQGNVFVTRYWRAWNKDAIVEQFRKLCLKAQVPCLGFYRLRHSASTAVSLVASPHVQRKFMRHAQLQQQVTYTHTPDAEVDEAIMKARARFLAPPTSTSNSENNLESEHGASTEPALPPDPAASDDSEIRSGHLEQSGKVAV